MSLFNIGVKQIRGVFDFQFSQLKRSLEESSLSDRYTMQTNLVEELKVTFRPAKVKLVHGMLWCINRKGWFFYVKNHVCLNGLKVILDCFSSLELSLRIFV